jgi:hypothetical protein
MWSSLKKAEMLSTTTDLEVYTKYITDIMDIFFNIAP